MRARSWSIVWIRAPVVAWWCVLPAIVVVRGVGLWLVGGCFGAPCVAASICRRLGTRCESVGETVRWSLGAGIPGWSAVSCSVGGAASIVGINCSGTVCPAGSSSAILGFPGWCSAPIRSSCWCWLVLVYGKDVESE